MEIPEVEPGGRICGVDDLEDGRSVKFRVGEEGRLVEAFLIRFEGRFYGYRNRCAHMALSLDLSDNDFFTVDFRHLICKTHGAVYEPSGGLCVSGPCLGGRLSPIGVAVRDGEVVRSDCLQADGVR